MKTLIFNGSPRKNGDTKSLINHMTESLNGEYKIVDAYFCARFYRKENPITKHIKGGVILVGGGDGSVEKAYGTACTLLHQMNSRDIAPFVVSHNTDEIAAKDDLDAMEQVKELADFLNCIK